MTTPVVLITGSSSGIGRSLCWEFRHQGFRVIATTRRRETLFEFSAAGIMTLTLDVTQPEQIQQVLVTLRQQQVPLDILVNNADYGIFGPPMDLSRTGQTHTR